jgi:hypothetical protein
MLEYRQDVLWIQKKCSCAGNVAKFQYHKITTQSGVWVSLLVVTSRNFKCGYSGVVLFRRIIIFLYSKI